MLTNQVVKLLEMDKQTMYYYEKLGLVKPSRDENGYREYTQEDVQKLMTIQFLRKMEFSLDSIAKVLEGELSFHESLQVHQEQVTKQMQELEKLHQRIQILQEKQLPLIPALQDIDLIKEGLTIGFHKTTKRASIGRRTNKKLLLKRMLWYALTIALLTVACIGGYVTIMHDLPSVAFVVAITVCFILIFSYILFYDDAAFRFVEFTETGMLFYQRESIGQQFRYICSILKKEDEKYLHFVKYSNIEKLVIRCTKRYTKIVMTNLYTDMYLADFAFHFKDLPTLYITSAMILENDSQLIGYLLKEKVASIVDPKHVLDMYCQGNNLTESMMNK